MKPRVCPFCAETPRTLGLQIDHFCRLIGHVRCSIENWNTRLKQQREKPEQKEELGLKIERSPRQIARDNLLYALASAELCEPVDSLTGPEARRHAAALSIIQFITPLVTPEEIRRRASNYRTYYDQDPTSNALAKWWRRCESPNRRSFGRPTAEQVAARADDRERRETQNLARQVHFPT
jgi:hypothetical protein